MSGLSRPPRKRKRRKLRRGFESLPLLQVMAHAISRKHATLARLQRVGERLPRWLMETLVHLRRSARWPLRVRLPPGAPTTRISTYYPQIRAYLVESL
jgi:hypothetical protein